MDTMCRACLTLGNLLQPMDDHFIHGYKILTNISVITSDGLPQFTCTSCSEKVANFMLFRDKCIESENTLKHILSETIDSKDGIIKDELVNGSSIKAEFQIKEEINVEINQCFDNDDDIDSLGHENQDPILYGIEYGKNVVLNKKKKVRKSRRKIQSTSKVPPKKKENMVSTFQIITVDKTILRCGICSKQFEDRIKLNEHLETHKNFKECELCRENFHEWPSLLAHRITHIEKLKEKRCHYCNMLFKSKHKLELHYRLLHYDGENKMLPCKYCPKSFSSGRKLNRHNTRNHKATSQIFQCDHCNKLISSKPGLITHLRKHSEDRPFKCDLCDYSCKYISGVGAHKKRKHGATKAVYCKTCGRYFPSIEKRDKHDCKSRATICPICGVIKSKRLTEHMATHHLGILFKCELCPAEFKSKSALKVHTDKHSGNRRYACEFCPMKFYVSEVLKKHRLVHKGEKPFVCKVCQRGFTGRHNLKVHMKVHGEDLVVKRVKNPPPAEEDTHSGLFYAPK